VSIVKGLLLFFLDRKFAKFISKFSFRLNSLKLNMTYRWFVVVENINSRRFRFKNRYYLFHIKSKNQRFNVVNLVKVKNNADVSYFITLN